MSVLIITGTGTEVGKTIVTAALAATASDAGLRVAVVKLAQTGIAAGDESDVDIVTRLSGVTDVQELARYPEPLAPATAARRAGVAALPVAAMVDRVRALSDRDVVLVEGAGGVLVRLDDDGHTVVDVVAALDAAVVVVTPAGLGTLNATALTCAALRARGVRCAGVVIGSWPAEPDLAAQANLEDLPSYAGVPLLGVLPAGCGGLDPKAFRAMAVSRLDATTLTGALAHCR